MNKYHCIICNMVVDAEHLHFWANDEMPNRFGWNDYLGQQPVCTPSRITLTEEPIKCDEWPVKQFEEVDLE